MRITLNLASRPYVELRPLYLRLRALAGILAVTALLCWWVLRSEHSRAMAAEARAEAVQHSIAGAQQQRQQSEAVMRQPANAAVLAQAQFLNNLFLQKAFSWTAVMMDLERVLPAGVQVMNIDPQVAKDGNVVIRMRVAGPRERAVDLMRNLEKSSRFLGPRLVGESTQSNQGPNGNMQAVSAAGPTGVNFDIVADYNPLPSAPATEEKSRAAGQKPVRRRHIPKPNPAASAGRDGAEGAGTQGLPRPRASRAGAAPGMTSGAVSGAASAARGGAPR